MDALESLHNANEDPTQGTLAGYSLAAGCIFSRPQNDNLLFYQLDPTRGLVKQVGSIDAPYSSFWTISFDGSRLAITDKSVLDGQVMILNLKDATQRNAHFGSLVRHSGLMR